jgi:hypothetical protein
MSSEPRHLADWIRALLAALDRAEPHSAAAVRRLASDRRATILLDTDRAAVSFADDRLMVRRLPGRAAPSAPFGATDRATVAAILAGYLEVAEAVSEGRLEIRGDTDEVIAMCAILEVLVDASTRIPDMQALAAAFLAASPAPGERAARALRRAAGRARAARERAFLAREGLGAAPRPPGD